MTSGFLAAAAARRPPDLVRVGREATEAVQAVFEEACGIVVGFGLHVLAEGERHRAAFGRVGQHGHRPAERRHDLLGPHDAVEIARDRAETVVGADRPVAEILDLLQNRIGPAAGEDVAGNEQHRQAIDMRHRGGGDHVGRARPDRGRAGHHAPAARGLGEGDRRMRHRLLVVGAIGRQRLARGVERFAEPGDIAVAEDGEHALEEPLLAAVDLHLLRAEEPDHRLRGRQSDCLHRVGPSSGMTRAGRAQRAQQ